MPALREEVFADCRRCFIVGKNLPEDKLRDFCRLMITPTCFQFTSKVPHDVSFLLLRQPEMFFQPRRWRLFWFLSLGRWFHLPDQAYLLTNPW